MLSKWKVWECWALNTLLGLLRPELLQQCRESISLWLWGLRWGEPGGQLRTGIAWSLNQVLVALVLCAGAKACWKMTSWSWSTAGSMRFSQTSCKPSGPTPADDLDPQTITDCGSFTLLKHRGFRASPLSSSRLWDLDFQSTCKMSCLQRTLDHSAAVQSFLSSAQLRRLWRCFLFKILLFVPQSSPGCSYPHYFCVLRSRVWHPVSPILNLSTKFKFSFH